MAPEPPYGTPLTPEGATYSVKITPADDVNHSEAATITAITAVAAMRGGVLTTRQQRRIDAILAAAKKREDKNRAKAATT